MLANPLAMVESPQGDVAPLAVHGTAFPLPSGTVVVLSVGPPASYTTWTFASLWRAESMSTVSQLRRGNTSLKPAKPARSVLLLPSR